MPIQVKKLHPLIGAEITGINLAQPLTPKILASIEDTWSEYNVLVFPNQPITDEQQVAFTRYFGELEIFPQAANRSSQIPEIFQITNVGENNQIRPIDTPGAKYSTLIYVWHSDSSYRLIPSKGAVLHAIEIVKVGGDTLFADMCAAYEQMPNTLRNEIEGLRARHSFAYSRQLQNLPAMEPAEEAKVPPVEHPLVRQHSNGRRSLYLSATYMEQIVGVSESVGARLIEELIQWGAQDRFVYRHRWQPHDVLMWDNRRTMHAVQPFDHANERRMMHRTTIAGTEPVSGI